MPSSSQSVERKPNKSIPGCKKPFNLPICFEIMCIFANEFGVLFCVSFHPEIDPICLSLQKEELLDLKRQRADTETRERACNICLTSETKGLGHLSQSLFAPCFLRLSFKAIMGGGGSCNFDAHCCHYLCSMATRMPPDDGWWLCRGLFKKHEIAATETALPWNLPPNRDRCRSAQPKCHLRLW